VRVLGVIAAVSTTLAVALSPDEALASGFFIDQQSVVGLGRADAGDVAAAADLGTIFFNPAGLSSLWDDGSARSRFAVGLSLIVPQSDLADTGSTAATPGTLGAAVPSRGSNASDPSDPTPVLSAYYARRLRGDRLSLGFRVNSPFGLAAQYDADWFGRYDSTRAELTTLSVGSVLAYELSDTVTLAGGLDVEYADSKLGSAIPNPLVPGGPTPATDGRFEAEGDDWSTGANVGLLAHLGASTRVGVHYRSGIEHDISGSATTAGLTGPLAPFNGTVGAKTKLKLPSIVSAGIAYDRPGSNFALYGDYTHYGWGTLQTIAVEFADGSPPVVRTPSYRDSYTVAVGFDYRFTPQFTLRGGLKHDQSPTQDAYRDTTFADDDRFWITIGGSLRRSDRMTIDFAVVHVLVDDTSVDVTRTFFAGTPLASKTTTRASVTSVVDTLAVGFRFDF